jgi:CheY-like chemotaxis protein
MMPRRVLIVEDDERLQTLWTDLLRGQGYGVVAVDDGALALVEIPRFEPDLILLDLLMPKAEVDGLALLHRLSASATLAKVPVVVVSGLGESVAAAITPETAKRLGIVAVIHKPVEGELLLREIARAIGEQNPWPDLGSAER